MYQDIISTCNYGHVQYDRLHAPARNFTVTRDFAEDVCSLLQEPEEDTIYQEFIKSWGTVCIKQFPQHLKN